MTHLFCEWINKWAHMLGEGRWRRSRCWDHGEAMQLKDQLWWWPLNPNAGGGCVRECKGWAVDQVPCTLTNTCIPKNYVHPRADWEHWRSSHNQIWNNQKNPKIVLYRSFAFYLLLSSSPLLVPLCFCHPKTECKMSPQSDDLILCR